MKKFLLVFASIVLLGYLVFSLVFFNDSSKKEECSAIEISIKDSLNIRFLKQTELEKLLTKENVHPVGKLMNEVNTLAIRDALMSNKAVKNAKVYIKGDKVYASVYQRRPVFRAISNTKGSFYVDNEREVMPVSNDFSTYLPVATGAIDEEFATNELFDFIMYLNDNPNWEAWVDQIVVKPNKDVDLIPHAGDFRIAFGKLDNYNEKFSRLSLFFEKGLNVVGWNRYSIISLKYDNQVVCTRK